MRYRPEIDGLRAIAVIPVIFFHAGVQLFSGGFVGVDVFFVISGYLITTIILAELVTGQFSLLKFYERRARRILPALYMVMALCLPFAWLWLMPSDVKELSNSVMAALVFASNIFFWRQSDYFDAATELKPLLHTWSLGVEEQFYVLFPMFLMVAWRLGRKWIVVLLAIVALLSLVLAELAISRKPDATFFLLPTRGWELAVGVLIAFYLEGKERGQFPPALNQILSLVGLGLIAFGVLAFSKETVFPGFSALIPTVGAGLIIVFALPETLVGRLLGSRALVGVGLVSYSAYLWHQPLLSFARHRSFTEPPDLVIALIVVLTFGLAYVTWRYVEQPFRQQNTIPKRWVWRFSFASAVVLAVCAVGLQLTTAAYDSRLNRDADALSRLHTCLFDAQQTVETLVQNHCDSVRPSAIRTDGGQARTSPVYVLFGDSLAASLYPGLVGVLGENAIIQLTGTSCRAIRSGHDRRCTDFYDWFVDEYVPNNQMDGILVTSSWLKTYQELGDKEFRVQLGALFEKLKKKRVIIYSQAASLSLDIHRYVYKLETFGMEVPNNLEVEADGLDTVNAALSEEAEKFGFEFIDASQVFCLKSKCTVAKDGVFYFWDTVHLTRPGSALLAEVTESLLSGIHPEQFRSRQDRLKKDGIPFADALMVRNLDGTIRYWSNGAKKLYGWEPHDALGTTSHQLLKTVFPVPLEVIEEELSGGRNLYRLSLTVNCFSWGVVWYSGHLDTGHSKKLLETFCSCGKQRSMGIPFSVGFFRARSWVG
ncbi:MAG: acyltransferase family protein [Nitrospira sp.]|nr:acyltransferase family protein [Nitrospira sp.]